MSLKVQYDNEPFCECCGERHTDFAASIEGGGTHWCVDCDHANNDLTDEEYKDICIMEREERRKWLEKRAKEVGIDIVEEALR